MIIIDYLNLKQEYKHLLASNPGARNGKEVYKINNDLEYFFKYVYTIEKIPSKIFVKEKLVNLSEKKCIFVRYFKINTNRYPPFYSLFKYQNNEWFFINSNYNGFFINLKTQENFYEKNYPLEYEDSWITNFSINENGIVAIIRNTHSPHSWKRYTYSPVVGFFKFKNKPINFWKQKLVDYGKSEEIFRKKVPFCTPEPIFIKKFFWKKDVFIYQFEIAIWIPDRLKNNFKGDRVLNCKYLTLKYKNIDANTVKLENLKQFDFYDKITNAFTDPIDWENWLLHIPKEYRCLCLKDTLENHCMLKLS
jgi:hypothetical protein